jgi:hypothetical protein
LLDFDFQIFFSFFPQIYWMTGRATRLGEISPLNFWQYFEINRYEFVIFEQIFTEKIYLLILIKMGWATFWATFFFSKVIWSPCRRVFGILLRFHVLTSKADVANCISRNGDFFVRSSTIEFTYQPPPP